MVMECIYSISDIYWLTSSPLGALYSVQQQPIFHVMPTLSTASVNTLPQCTKDYFITFRYYAFSTISYVTVFAATQATSWYPSTPKKEALPPRYCTQCTLFRKQLWTQMYLARNGTVPARCWVAKGGATRAAPQIHAPTICIVKSYPSSSTTSRLSKTQLSPRTTLGAVARYFCVHRKKSNFTFSFQLSFCFNPTSKLKSD